jgi:hypothetical protein
MSEIKFPEQPFYIMSRINSSNWVLTISGANAVCLQPLTGTIDQMWTAVTDPRGGMTLRHIDSGRVLACQLGWSPFEVRVPQGALVMADLNSGDATQLWKADDLGQNSVGITPFLNWNARVNVYGNNDVHGTVGIWRWSGGAPNESWLLVTEMGGVTVTNVEYDLTRVVTDLGMPPSQCAGIVIDNLKGGTPVESTYALQRSITTTRTVTHSESDTTGHKYTQTFGAKGGLDKVFEVSASASFEESDSTTLSLTDAKGCSETKADTMSTQVHVPPGKRYGYQVMVHYGKISVPYTATMVFQSATAAAAPVTWKATGVFTGVNSTQSEVAVADLTVAGKETLVERRALL